MSTPTQPSAGAITLRAENSEPEGWRVIFRHRIECKSLGEGVRGIRVELVPDDKGDHFTTIAKCPNEQWAKKILGAFQAETHAGELAAELKKLIERTEAAAWVSVNEGQADQHMIAGAYNTARAVLANGGAKP